MAWMIRTILAILTIFLLARTAEAEGARPEPPPVGIIDLDVEAEGSPKTVCVIARRFVKAERQTPYIEAAARFSGPKIGAAKDELNSLLKSMQERRSQAFAQCDADDCGPKFEFDERQFGTGSVTNEPQIVCRSNGAAPVILIAVDFRKRNGDSGSYSLKDLNFHGNVVSFVVDSDNDSDYSFFTAQVVGGDFLKSEREIISSPDIRRGSRATVPALRRCPSRRLRLPPNWSGETRVRASAGTDSPRTCSTRLNVSSDKPIEVFVPNAARGVPKSVRAIRAPVVSTDKRAYAEGERAKVSFQPAAGVDRKRNWIVTIAKANTPYRQHLKSILVSGESESVALDLAGLAPGPYEARLADGEGRIGTSATFLYGSAAPVEDAERSATAEAEWTELAPSEGQPLELKELTLSWTPHCLYRSKACPTVTLPELNVTCQSLDPTRSRGAESECEYRCVHGTGIKLPARVELRHPSGRSWTDTLNRHDQRLSSYLASSDRFLSVEFENGSPSVERLERQADAINHVQLDLDGGRTYILGPHAQSVSAPGLDCNMGYRALIWGDRSFISTRTTVDGERIVIASPDLQAKNVILKLAAGGGMGVPTSDARNWMFASGMVGLSLRPAASPWSVDLAAGYMFSTHDYYPLQRTGRTDSPRDTIPFTRVPIQAGVSLYIGYRLAFGLAGLVVIEQAAFREDEDRGGRLNAAYGFSADARLHFGDGVWLAVVPGRFIGNEVIHRHVFDGSGSSRIDFERTLSWVPAVELRGEWAIGRIGATPPNVQRAGSASGASRSQ